MKSKSFHLKWSSHFPNMEKVFAGLVNSETLTDVSIVCSDGQVLKSHRLLLSSSSGFLHNLFMDSPESSPVIFLPEVLPEVLGPLLHFIYTGEIQIEDEDLLKEMLELSEILFVKGLDVALEDRRKKAVPAVTITLTSTENNGNKRKTRSPRQYILTSPTRREEEPRDLSSRKEHQAVGSEEDVLRDRTEHNIMTGDDSSYGEETPSKLMCLDEVGGQAWASNHHIFSSMLPKLECDPLTLPHLPRIKQEDCSSLPPPFPPPVNLTSEHISNILNTTTVPICPLCSKDCANFPNLRTHLQTTHNNSKPFACDFCDSKFTRASHLSRHRRSHTGEKPFECSICGKLFSRQDKLKVHVDRHRLKEEKEMKMNGGSNWSLNAAFPSQVSPYPSSSYYDSVPKNNHGVATLMPSFIG